MNDRYWMILFGCIMITISIIGLIGWCIYHKSFAEVWGWIE